MEFTVEFYETSGGTSPVREFLEELRCSDAGRSRMSDWQKRFGV